MKLETVTIESQNGPVVVNKDDFENGVYPDAKLYQEKPAVVVRSKRNQKEDPDNE